MTLKIKVGEYQFVFLGDYIDRGDNSKECIDLLIEFKEKRPESKFLLGNHEEFLLCYIDPTLIHDPFLKEEHPNDIFKIWMNNGGSKTLESYNIPLWYQYDKTQGFPEDHINFFKSLDYIYQQRRIIFVHAGIDKTKPLNKNTIGDLLWSRPPFGFLYETQRVVVHGHTRTQKIALDTVEMTIDIDTGCCNDSGRLSVLEIDENQKIIAIHEYK